MRVARSAWSGVQRKLAAAEEVEEPVPQLFGGILFPFLFSGCPTKNGLPRKGSPFFPRVTEQLRYIFVGDSIFSFESEAEICKFSSPVGNNDVPYPWAADVDGRCYLVIENTVLSAVPEGDPYDAFLPALRAAGNPSACHAWPFVCFFLLGLAVRAFEAMLSLANLQPLLGSRFF